MMRNSWTLKGRLQYILAKGLLQKNENDDNEWKKKEPKCDGYMVSPYLRQRFENL